MQSDSNSACFRCGKSRRLLKSGTPKLRCEFCKFYNLPENVDKRTGPPPSRTFTDLGEKIRCRVCKRYLGHLEEFTGRVTFFCRECKSPTTLESGAVIGARTPIVENILDAMHKRWEEFRIERIRQKGTIAVGIRFRVFQRDGFRCRYCGVSVDDGAILHADHVIPESKGGPTTLENLVTACIDCNLGKSDRPLTGMVISA